MEHAYNNEELENLLGENLKDLRLQKNIDRQTLCNQAGISLNALRHLEGGEGATVKTLIRVIRALQREAWLLSVAPQISINPLHLTKKSTPRQRARPKKVGNKNGKKQKK